MFTGIIEETGKILTINSSQITVECVLVLENTKIGDSIAVNGICLTVTSLSTNSFTADISPETCKITSLHNLSQGSIVNLERAMKCDGRFGGHIVSGHIDGLAKCVGIKILGDFYEIKFELPAELAKYVIKKGSITIDGISLTVAEIDGKIVTIAIIPHTYENTNLQKLKIGANVNIEVDILAKYVEKFLLSSDNKSRISLEFLQEHGF